MAQDDYDRQRLSTYPLPAPPPPPYPVVETRMPTVPQPDAQAGQAAFGVPPSMGARPGEPPRPGPVRAVLGQQAASVPQDEDAGMGYGEQMRNVGGFVANAVGGLAKEVFGAPGHGISRLLNGSGAPGVPGAALPVATAAAATVPRGPAVAAAAPVVPPAALPAPAAAGTPVEGAPGAYRFVDPSGRVLYTDQAGGAPAAAGASVAAPGATTFTAPSMGPAAAAGAANTVQAGATLPSGLDQRLAEARAAAVARGEPLGPSAAAGGLPAGYGATIGADTGGVGILDAGYQRARSLRMDAESAAQTAAKIGSAGRPLAEATGKALANFEDERSMGPGRAAANTAREAAATERTRIADTGQTVRERETTAATTAREGPLRAAQTAEAVAKGQLSAGHAAALSAYQKAVAGGDPKAIQKAEEALRAAQGKYEKAAPADAYSAVAVPGGVNEMGQSIGSSVAIVNKATGEPRIVSAADVKAGGAGAAAPPAKAVEMLRADPKLAAHFDQKYGAGAAARLLGQR